AADIYAQVAGQGENKLQALQVFVSVQARVALGPGRLEQAFALVEAQSLRMDAIHLCDRRDHVRALGFPLGHDSTIWFDCIGFAVYASTSLLYSKTPKPRINTNPHEEIREICADPWLISTTAG